MPLPPADRSDSRDANEDPLSPGETGLKSTYDESWAVIVGINDYQNHTRLEFAAADAVGMARVLIDRMGFLPQHVSLVVSGVADLPAPLGAWLTATKPRLGAFSEVATKAVIEQLLFTMLPERTRSNDRVLIYFAGHGKQRPAQSKQKNAKPYLVPVEAQQRSWHQYIELNGLLDQSADVPAKHIFYVLDACCSGLAGLRADDQATRYESGMLSRKARLCLTAGTAEEYVADRGYDGHSLFTWHVLQMLAQLDPRTDDGALPASLLAAEIKQRVGKDGQSGQTPSSFSVGDHGGGDFVFFVREPTLSIEDSVALAGQIVDEVGRELDEPAPIAFAAQLCRRVLLDQTTDAQRTIAQRELARTSLLLGENTTALQELSDASLRNDPEAMLFRTMARLRLSLFDEAAGDLATLAAMGVAHPYAGWAASVAAVAQKPRGKRYALLIGVNEIDGWPERLFPGAQNDVKALGELLERDLSFRVAVLTGSQATRAGIEAALDEYVAVCEPDDSFVYAFCGLGFLRDGVANYATYDMTPDGSGITENTVDDRMRSIKAHDKLLITDGCHLAPLGDLAGYRALFGCQRDEMAVEITTADGAQRGAFTYLLEEALRVLGNAPLDRLVSRVSVELAARQISQTPGYSGSDVSAFIGRRLLELELVEFAEQSVRSFTPEDVQRFEGWLEANDPSGATMMPLWLALGHAHTRLRQDVRAIEAFKRSRHPRSWLPLLRAELRCGRYVEAFEHWIQWQGVCERSSDTERPIAELNPLLEHFRVGTRRALLVATDPNDELGLEAQLRAAEAALIERWGLLPSQVTVRVNASKAELIAAFDQLTRAAGGDPAFFLFIGPGFDAGEVWLCTADALEQHGADLSLAELRTIASDCNNLTTAVVLTSTFSPRDKRFTSGAAFKQARSSLGAGMLLAAPDPHRDVGLRVTETPPNVASLLRALIDGGHGTVSLQEWLRAMPSTRGVTIRGDGNAAVLSYGHDRDRAIALLLGLEQAPLRRILPFLHRLIDDSKLAAEACLVLAIINTELRDYHAALVHLDAAIARRRVAGSSVTAGSVQWTEAHYWRGRILLGLGRFAEAAHALAEAIQQDPKHARAYYQRVQAIRQLIETDLETELRSAAQHYTELGAPNGIDDELRQILRRPNPKDTSHAGPGHI